MPHEEFEAICHRRERRRRVRLFIRTAALWIATAATALFATLMISRMGN